jgi:hypothetical protein
MPPVREPIGPLGGWGAPSEGFGEGDWGGEMCIRALRVGDWAAKVCVRSRRQGQLGSQGALPVMPARTTRQPRRASGRAGMATRQPRHASGRAGMGNWAAQVCFQSRRRGQLGCPGALPVTLASATRQPRCASGPSGSGIPGAQMRSRAGRSKTVPMPHGRWYGEFRQGG